jgi:Transglutaminase-like superfamily
VRTIRLSLAKPIDAACEIMVGLPINTPEQRLIGGDIRGAASASKIIATNSGQAALSFPVNAGGQPTVTLEFADETCDFPDWVFEPTGGRHETPSSPLLALMRELAPETLVAVDRVERIIRHVEGRFAYGVRDVGLGDDADAMPALACDTHLGTCVDTHSYAVAAMRAAGIEAAYISGLFFPEGAIASEPGHCWLVVRAEGAPHHWDISHFLKYGLGPVRPILNPKPGFRYAMSVGRDLTFEGRDGPITFSRLSGFNVLSGPDKGAKLKTQAGVVATVSVAA